MRASLSNSEFVTRCARLGILASAIALTACTQPEIDRPGTWQPMGANERNLRAMLANPQDAYGGTGAITSRGNSGSRAVTRLLTDRRRPLLDASTSQIGAANGSQSDGGAGPVSGGGASAGGL